MLLKKAKESWKGNFDKVLASSERKEFANARRYYEGEYLKAIDDFLKTGKATGFDNLFRVADFTEIYRQVYVNIGLKFAKWYSKNFDKVISKQTDVSGYDDIWAERFNRVSQQIAAERVTLVQGTAKATLVNVFKRLSSDPEFMVMGEREAGRILRQKFGQYSKSQAERLIRTESTNAANIATLQSATDMFGQDNLQKEWMTAIDGRERPAHRGADGQIVDFKERFLVGGEQLFNPGDPAGSAKNVVNCRCSTAPFPKENAQATGTIEGFGVRPPGGSTQSILRTPKPVREAVEEVVDFDKMSKKDIDKFFVDEFKKQGITIKNINSNNLTKYQYKRRVEQFKKLSDEYNINYTENIAFKEGVELHFKVESNGAWGKVSRFESMAGREYPSNYVDGMLRQINFGNKSVNSLKNKQISKLKFDRHFANINPELDDLYVLTHEFGHIISTDLVGSHKQFWTEFREIKTRYFTELRKYQFDNYTEITINGQTRLTKYKNLEKYNQTAISNYAHKNDDEILAEAFSEYKLSDNPSRWAREFGELIDKYFKK
jgi:hypothetical protein